VYFQTPRDSSWVWTKRI